MDYRNNNIAPRYPQQHSLPHPHQHQVTPPSASGSAFYPAHRASIDVDTLTAGVQHYLPGPRQPSSYPLNSSYISLPPGVDPATVDFRTFYPYNPSEVKHRKRTTRPQLKVLEETFKRETKPNAALRKTLAAQLEMTPRGVQVWFQNRRAKEKTLAKKASSSANGRKSISLSVQNDDGAEDDGVDVDCDDGDVAAEDEVANGEQAAHHPGQAPGTAYAMDEGRRSHSSSNSPEDTSPELTPPIASADIPPHVSVSPPVDDDSTTAPAMPEPKLMGNGLPPTSWPGPPRSMSRTPTSRIRAAELGNEYPGEQGLGMNHMMPGQDHFSRRPSLPTHLSIGPARMRASHYGSPRMLPSGVSAARMGFDPNARRMSLDRLASHPYAHLAAQANSVVYGTGMPRFRPSLPPTTQSTPTLTPQAHNAELPLVHGGSDGTGSGHTSDSGSNSGLPELSLPPHLQAQTPLVGSVPDSDVRPDLTHRQSLPAHLAMPPRFGSSSAGLVAPPQSASAGTAHMQMRFPRAEHVYALSTRNYQPPIAGPLPNPDFSFGSVGSGDANGNGEGEAAHTDGARTPDNQLQTQLNSYTFPQADDGKDDGSGVGGGNGLDMEMESDPHSAALAQGGIAPIYYVGAHEAAGPYASRFGSMASITSIAESESSATSGSFFNSETSSYNVRHDDLSSAGHSSVNYNDSRRASCTSQIISTMFSHMDVQNGSQSSLPLTHNSREQDPHSSQVPISRTSELSLALIHDDGADNGNHLNMNLGDVSDHGSYHRSSMSSSDLSHGHAPPLSAASSRSSLGIPSHRHHPRHLQRIDTEEMGFRRNFDAVSETGHYSPVSHPASMSFEFPMDGPLSRSVSVHSNGSANDDMDHDGGMMGRTPPSSHQYGVDESCGQQPTSAPYYQAYTKDGNYASQPQQSFQMHSNSQENLTPYGGYYNQ